MTAQTHITISSDLNFLTMQSSLLITKSRHIYILARQPLRLMRRPLDNGIVV